MRRYVIQKGRAYKVRTINGVPFITRLGQAELIKGEVK